jgi:2,3-diphosphopglycerate-independent phosphoglycerate mutase
MHVQKRYYRVDRTEHSRDTEAEGGGRATRFGDQQACSDFVDGTCLHLQCNFAYLNLSTVEVELRRADRNFEDVGPTLCKMLDGQEIPSFPNHSVAVKYATEHRCGVRVRGPGLSDNVTGTDPLKDNLPLRESMPLDSSEEAALTARLVNALSRHITEKLQQHPINRQRIEQGKPPANCVLLRGCGARVKVPTFIDLHGIKPFMIAPTCLIRGLGASLEMDIIDVPGGTGDYFTDLSAKAAYALRAFADKEKAYDLGFVHVKAVDDAGHDRSLPRKFEFLRKFDDMTLQLVRGLAALEQQTGDRVVVCVTGDHSTPVDYGDHSAEPVPFSIAAVRDVLRHLDKVCPRHSCLLPLACSHASHSLAGMPPPSRSLTIFR